jgi:hypothetical protein
LSIRSGKQPEGDEIDNKEERQLGAVATHEAFMILSGDSRIKWHEPLFHRTQGSFSGALSFYATALFISFVFSFFTHV